MTEAHHQTTPAPEISVGRRPTRELELVISGALIVALLQVPGLLTDWLNDVWLHVDTFWAMVPFMFIHAALMVLYPVILCFSLHFAMRGFWVGLLGLDAVFPNGIVWENLPGMEIEKVVYRNRGDSVPALIERVDKASSLLFSLMFSVTLNLMNLYGLSAILTMLFVAIAYQLTDQVNPLALMAAAFILAFLLAHGTKIFAALLTRPLNKDPEWADRHPRRYAVGLALAKIGYAASFSFLTHPILWTQTSHINDKRMKLIHLALMTAVSVCAVGSLFIGNGTLRLSSDIWSPAHGREQSAYAHHYENRMDPNHPRRRTTIQSDMITDDYLRLTIPLSPGRNNKRMAFFCDDLEPFRREGVMFGPKRNSGDSETRAALLACYSRWITVTLDDQKLEPEFLFSRNPVNSMPELISYIPCRALSDGHHLLTVSRKPLESDSKKQGDQQPTASYIPFWKSSR